MEEHRSKRVTADNLDETVAAGVARALEARAAKTELSADEIAQVSGAALPTLPTSSYMMKPIEWFGIFPEKFRVPIERLPIPRRF